MNFTFNKMPDHVSKDLVLCSLNFIVDSFINKAQFDAGFSESLKLKDNIVPTILDSTVLSQHTRVTVFITWSPIALPVITDCLICMSIYVSICEGCRLSNRHNHSSGRLLLSLQFAMPIQTEHSDEGGQNRTENNLLLWNYDVFLMQKYW